MTSSIVGILSILLFLILIVVVQVSLRGASAKEITRDDLLQKVSRERELRNYAKRAAAAALFIQVSYIFACFHLAYLFICNLDTSILKCPLFFVYIHGCNYFVPFQWNDLFTHEVRLCYVHIRPSIDSTTMRISCT